MSDTPDDRKPSSGPAGDPVSSRGAARPGPGSAGRPPEFDIIRTAPTPGAGGGSPMPLVILIVLAAIGGGAFFLLRGEPETEDKAPVTIAEPKEVPPPAWLIEQLDFREGENLAGALALAEENLATYPSAELRARIKRYREELGLVDVEKSQAELLAEARAAAKDNDWEQVRDLADAALAQGDSAEAYFLRGVGNGELGNGLAAQNDLQSALDLGYQPEAEVKALIERFAE